MQFKRQFVPLILNGTKTQTRRLKKSWYAPGKIVAAQCGYREKAFARLRILRVWQQKLADMTVEEVRAEGFDHWVKFLEAFAKINNCRIQLKRASDSAGVWAIEFEVVKE